MRESILRDKLKEFQLFIMENRYSRGLKSDSKNDEDRKKGEAILKDFFNGMVEGKPITKAIEILEYIKEHKWEKTKFKNGDNEERIGVWQYGENFFVWSDLVIDYLVDSLEDMAKKMGGSSLVTKEQSKQPQQNKKPSFSACILANNKDEYLKGLHGLIDGNVGKFVAMVIQAAIETKGIVKPSSTQVKDEFGNIGNISGYNNYMKVDFSKELDFKNLKDVLLELKK